MVDVVWLLPLIGYALVAVSMWMFAKGLADAGARPSRPAVITIAAVGVGLSLLSIAPLFVGDAAPVELNDQLRLGVSIPISVAIVAFSFVAALRLVIGWWSGLLPFRAWVTGAAWGVITIGVPVIAMALQYVGSGELPEWAWTIYALVILVQGYLLFIAFALGLGRGPALRRRRFSIWA